MWYLYYESKMRDLKTRFQKVQRRHLNICVSVMAALPLFAVLTVVFVSVLNLHSIHGTADHQNP